MLIASAVWVLTVGSPLHLDTAAAFRSHPVTGVSRAGQGMNREGAPGKSPEEMYIQQKVRVLLMLRKMGSNLTASEEEFLRTYAGVVNSQLSQLPQHSIDQGLCPGPVPGSRALTLGVTRPVHLTQQKCTGCSSGVGSSRGQPLAVHSLPRPHSCRSLFCPKCTVSRLRRR
ncbi:hypothetical protein CB1_000363012 [Camelus ferus]|nr:hypothetical protein CB1_000363012 [Camelus ferus]